MNEKLENTVTENMPDTHEYVIIGKGNYQAEYVITGSNSIAFGLKDITIITAVKKFSNVTELEISGADLQPYGIYKNLTFNSATVGEDGLVTVEFHIASAEEIRISNLEATQAEQDIAISNILFGEEV